MIGQGATQQTKRKFGQISHWPDHTPKNLGIRMDPTLNAEEDCIVADSLQHQCPVVLLDGGSKTHFGHHYTKAELQKCFGMVRNQLFTQVFRSHHVGLTRIASWRAAATMAASQWADLFVRHCESGMEDTVMQKAYLGDTHM